MHLDLELDEAGAGVGGGGRALVLVEVLMEGGGGSGRGGKRRRAPEQTYGYRGIGCANSIIQFLDVGLLPVNWEYLRFFK